MERALVPLIFVALAAVLWASLRRRVELDDDGIHIRRFIRTKDIPWADITNVDIMVLKKKAYLLLTSTRGFHVISNTISDFSRIARDIVENANEEAVDPAVPAALNDTPRRMSDAVLLWVAAAVMIAILSYKLAH